MGSNKRPPFRTDTDSWIQTNFLKVYTNNQEGRHTIV